MEYIPVKGLVAHDNYVTFCIFFNNKKRELLHTKKRQDYVCESLKDALGERCISSELQLAGPEYGHLQGFSSLPPAFAEELFSSELLDKVSLHPLSQDMKTLKTPTVTVDNSLSPVHTLLQIQCVDQKGLCYDIMRISKDSDIKVHANGLLLLPSEPLYMKLNQRK